MISLPIIYLLIFTYFLILPVNCLGIQIKSRKLPLQFNSRKALEGLFIQLKEMRFLESITRLLEMKTFDTRPAYLDSCVSTSSDDYRYIIEYCYMKGRDMKMLSKLLSGDCVMAMNESNFVDNTMALSLRDLPISPLSCQLGTFKMRKMSLASAYRAIVFQAIDSKATDVDWNNLLFGPHDSNQLSLSDDFDGYIHSTSKSRLFYYLRPNMLYFVTGKNILWLIDAVLPRIPTFSTDLYLSPHVDPKLLSFWTDQIFRTVSSLSFYFEVNSMEQKLFSNSINNLGADIESPLILLQAKIRALERFKALNVVVKSVLTSKLRCPPLERILNILNDLHNLFLVENFSIRKNFASNLYMKISERFKKYSHPSIQGDWMLNLFILFWERMNSKPTFNLEDLVIKNSILIFFTRNPTIKAINSVYILFESNFERKVKAGKMDSFETLIPNDRILELYKLQCNALPTRFRVIPFEIRYQLVISNARNIVSQNKKIYYNAKKFLAFPLSNSKTSSNYQNELVTVLISTIAALYRPLEMIYAYTTFELIKNGAKSPVDLVFCIKQFFKLILNIPQFRIIVESQSQYPEFKSSNRPVIVITPLITKSLANLFGQVLALSVILEIEVPFIMLKEQFFSMFSKDKGKENDINSMIRKFCDTPKHLKLLNYHINPLNFVTSISNYFKYFNSWLSVLYESSLKLSEDRNSFIDNAFTTCNYQILSGLKIYFNNSKFTTNEIYKMIFF